MGDPSASTITVQETAPRRAVAALRRHSAILDEVAYLRGVHRRLGGRRPVLVYTIGKVGTTALATGIEQQAGIPTLHLHFLNSKRNSTRGGADAPDRRRVAWRGDYARLRIALARRRPWAIVTGVRDPLSRAASAFFHLGSRRDLLRGSSAAGDVDLERLRDLFVERAARRFSVDWFDHELRRFTGIDVYATPFSPDQGHRTYENRRFRVLLLRFEDLGRTGATATSEFLGLPRPIELPRSNVTADKEHGELYRRFLDEVELPQWLVDMAYTSRVATHFYTDAEIAAQRANWERPA